MKIEINFQIAKVQPQGVAYHVLDFLPMAAWLIKKVFMSNMNEVCEIRENIPLSFPILNICKLSILHLFSSSDY